MALIRFYASRKGLAENSGGSAAVGRATRRTSDVGEGGPIPL